MLLWLWNHVKCLQDWWRHHHNCSATMIKGLINMGQHWQSGCHGGLTTPSVGPCFAALNLLSSVIATQFHTFQMAGIIPSRYVYKPLDRCGTMIAAVLSLQSFLKPLILRGKWPSSGSAGGLRHSHLRITGLYAILGHMLKRLLNLSSSIVAHI